MTAEMIWVPLTFDRGLNEFDQRTQLQQGDAVTLQNYEWLPNGGLTPRPKLRAAGAASSPSGDPSLVGRGVFGSWYPSGIRVLVAAGTDGTDFALYETDLATPDGFTTYNTIETGLAVDPAFVDLPVAFAVGNSKLLYTNPGFPDGRVRSWDGATVVDLDTDDMAGRSLTYHLNRFWTGGSAADPTLLRFTEIGDEAEWNVDENFIPVGQDDGEAICDSTVWDRGLVIGKAHSLWFLSGLDLDSFALSPIDNRIGVADGRTLVPSRYGVFMVGFDGNVSLWDGGAVARITERHRIETPPPLGYMSAAYVADKLLIHAQGSTRVDVFDPAEGRWRVEEYEVAAPQDMIAFDDRFLVASTIDGARMLSQREEIGPFLLGSARSPGGDAGVETEYIAETGELYPGGVYSKALLRHAYIRLRQFTGQTDGAGFTVTPVVDGVAIDADAKDWTPEQDAGVYTKRFDFGNDRNGYSFGVRISAVVDDENLDTYAFEEIELGISVETRRR